MSTQAVYKLHLIYGQLPWHVDPLQAELNISRELDSPIYAVVVHHYVAFPEDIPAEFNLTFLNGRAMDRQEIAAGLQVTSQVSENTNSDTGVSCRCVHRPPVGCACPCHGRTKVHSIHRRNLVPK